MSFKKSIKPIPLTALNTNALGAAYQPINAGGLPFICTKVRIINASSIGVNLSYDGINPHDYIPAGTTLELPFFLNTADAGLYTPMLKKHQVFSISSSVGVGVGFVFVSGYYQEAI